MSRFRTIKPSDARFEMDGLIFVTVKSKALRGRADITLFEPREAEGLSNIPLLVLLHGVYNSHWAWALKGAAHKTVQRLVSTAAIPPMALAMPSDGLWGDGSAYVAHGRQQDFETWVAEEVPAAACETMACVGESSPIFLNGLSMGGFGALRIGAKFPDRFAGFSGHSSITHIEQMKKFAEEDFGTVGVSPEDRSVLETILRHRDTLRPFRFDCGSSDLLVEENRQLHQDLNQNGIPHQYEEFPGGHEWPYWETHLEDALRFFCKTLNAQRK